MMFSVRAWVRAATSASRVRLATLGLAMSLLGAPVSEEAWGAEVGFTRVDAPDPGGAPIEVGIWYPTVSAGVATPLELFTQNVASDAPPVPSRHPLVVISHGNGGSLSGHYDTALALAHAGFVVAAVTHTGDNYRDHSRELRLQDRPGQIRAAVDFVLSGWVGHEAVDPLRIGMFGFSAGGFTTLVAIGGKPDLARMEPYCATHAATFVCALRRSHEAPATTSVPGEAWVRDGRIKSAIVAAPALGFTFSRAGLSDVAVPVQLWAAADDHVLPVADNAGWVRDALPGKPDYRLVAGADHFDFLAPCSQALARVAPPICGETAEFDRVAFHRMFNDAVVQFFSRTLGVNGRP